MANGSVADERRGRGGMHILKQVVAVSAALIVAYMSPTVVGTAVGLLVHTSDATVVVLIGLVGAIASAVVLLVYTIREIRALDVHRAAEVKNAHAMGMSPSAMPA